MIGTVVTGFDSSATPEGLNLRIRATGDSEFLAYQLGARYVVSVSARDLRGLDKVSLKNFRSTLKK